MGANPITRATKIRDVLILIVIPFALPALVLPLANGSSSFTLTNLGFGFVAVAVAGVARAVTSKADDWSAFALFALLCVCILTALAVVDDTAEASNRLTRTVLAEAAAHRPDISALRDAAVAVDQADPGTLHWVTCIAVGALLIAISFELIRREQ